MIISGDSRTESDIPSLVGWLRRLRFCGTRTSTRGRSCGPSTRRRGIRMRNIAVALIPALDLAQVPSILTALRTADARYVRCALQERLQARIATEAGRGHGGDVWGTAGSLDVEKGAAFRCADWQDGGEGDDYAVGLGLRAREHWEGEESEEEDRGRVHSGSHLRVHWMIYMYLARKEVEKTQSSRVVHGRSSAS